MKINRNDRFIHTENIWDAESMQEINTCLAVFPLSFWSTLWTLSVLPKSGLLSEDKSKPQRFKGDQNPLLKDIYSEKTPILSLMGSLESEK